MRNPDHRIEALRDCVELFEVWRDEEIFRSVGIQWIEEPPAIRRARAVIKEWEDEK